MEQKSNVIDGTLQKATIVDYSDSRHRLQCGCLQDRKKVVAHCTLEKFELEYNDSYQPTTVHT